MEMWKISVQGLWAGTLCVPLFFPTSLIPLCLLVLISNPGGMSQSCPSCPVHYPGFGSLAEQSPYDSVSFGGHSPTPGETWGKYHKVASWERSLGASVGLGLTGVSGWMRN